MSLILWVFAASAVAAGGPTPGVAVAGLSVPSRPVPATPILPDPFPFARVFVPTAVPPAGLRGMPREAFEAAVQAAAARPTDPPRLTAARYKATFTPAGLTGSAAWDLTARTAQRLPIDTLRVAVRNLRWADGTEPIIDRGTDTAAWAVLVPAGSWTLTFDWSVRGTDEPGEVRFDLRFPVAPMAALTLELPADRVAVPRTPNQLLTGPNGGQPGDWRFLFGGDAKLEFTVRNPNQPGRGGPFLTAGRTVRWDVQPAVAGLTAEFDLEAVRDPLRDVRFALDPRLTVAGVTGPFVDGWTVEAVAAGAPQRLIVRLRETTGSVRVTVTGQAVVPVDGTAWACPTIDPESATLTADAYDVRIRDELTLQDWEAGDHRLVRTSGGTVPRLSFVGTLPAEGARRRQLQFKFRPTGPAFTTVERLEWQPGSAASRLTADVQLTVLRGPLTTLTVRVPDGFTPVSATATPDDPSAGWSPGPAGTWTYEPSRPFVAGESAQLRFDFRGGPTPLGTVPVPRWGLPGAASRDTTLTVVVAPPLTARLTSDRATDNGLTLKAAAEPDGYLFLARRRPTAVLQTNVSVGDRRYQAEHRLTVRTPGPSRVFVPEAAGCVVQVIADAAVVEEAPLGLFGPGATVGWPILPLPLGRLWNVRPTSSGGDGLVVVRVSGDVEDVLRIPVPVAVGCDQADAVVDADGWDVEPIGADLVRFARLTPSANGPTVGGWQFTELGCETLLDASGSATVRLTGRIQAAAGRLLPVGLPDGATVTLATVHGLWADVRPTTSGVLVPVPLVPADGVVFELRYRRPAGTMACDPPELPGAPVLPHRIRATEAYVWPRLDTTTESPSPVVRLVPAWLPAAGGVVLAAFVCGLAVGGLSRPRAAGRVAVGAFLLLGASVWVVPDGWALLIVGPVLGVVVVAVAGFAWLNRRAAAVLAVGVLAAVGVGQSPGGPTVPTVYFTRAPTDPPDRLTAWVPDAVWQRLVPPRPVVVRSAEYNGNEIDSGAAFTAVFGLEAFDDSPAELRLPLTGVRLEAATLDGRPAFPTATDAGYLVRLPGPGRHELKLQFTVPVTAGADRELSFTVPDVPTARLRFVVSPTSRRPTVPTRWGIETVAGATLAADLGAVKSVRVRWKAGGPVDLVPVVGLTAAGVWDVTETTAELTAAFAFRVDRGAVSTFRFDVPAGFEPGRISVRADAMNGLRDWTFTPGDGPQPLTIEMRSPAEGTVLVVFHLYPRGRLSAAPRLPMPTCRDVSAAATYLGVRLYGVAPEKWENENLIDFPADAIAREVPPAADLGFDKPLARSLRREGNGPPVLRPTLRPPADPSAVSHEILWTFGPRADVAGTLRWVGPMPAVEFDVPPGVTLADVQAADLAGWSVLGSRVRVWFTADQKEVTVRWQGTWPRFPGASPTAFDLPTVPTSTARVRPADGWVVVAPPVRGGKTVAPSRPRETAFAADATTPPKVTVYPPTAGSARRWDTLVRTPTGLECRTIVDVAVAEGRPHHMIVGVVGTADVRMDPPAGSTVAELATGSLGRKWDLTLAASAARPRLVLVTKLAVKAGTTDPQRTTVTLPPIELTVAGVPVPMDVHAQSEADLEPMEVGRRVSRPADAPPEFARGRPVWHLPSSELMILAGVPRSEPRPRPEPPSNPPADRTATIRPWISAVGWVVGVAVLIGTDRWRRLWPERVLAFGGLVWFVVGSFGGVFLVLGVCLRAARVWRRIGKRVVR